MDFKSMSELEKYLQKQVSESLQKDVALEVRHLMREHIQKDVYKEYTPYSTDGTTPHYERTFELINSCETSMISEDTLEAKNTRTDKEDNAYIVPIIEYGKGYTWGYTRNLNEEIGPRPFIENTRKDLLNGLAKMYLKTALTKRGLNMGG